MSNEKNKKWSSRRFAIFAVVWLFVTAFAVYCIEKGAGVDWFSKYTMATVMLAFFAIGALTATDIVNKWKS